MGGGFTFGALNLAYVQFISRVADTALRVDLHFSTYTYQNISTHVYIYVYMYMYMYIYMYMCM